MKNDKFCFSKGTGVIALVGILLVGFVLVTQLVNQQVSIDSKAGSRAKWCGYNTGTFTMASPSMTVGGKTYDVDTTSGCITTGGVIVDGAKCKILSGDFTNSKAVYDKTNCPIPAGPKTCWYGNKDVTADMDAKGCISSAPGYKCKLNATTGELALSGRNAATKDTVTCPVAAAEGVCLYGGVEYLQSSGSIEANNCILKDGNNIGYRCRTSTVTGAFIAGRNSAVKDTVTCPVPAAPGRTQCSWGDKLLTVGTDVQSGAQVLNLDSNGCIQVDGFNNGYLCNASTAFKSVRRLDTCPL